jgi:hypothetical protein
VEGQETEIRRSSCREGRIMYYDMKGAAEENEVEFKKHLEGVEKYILWSIESSWKE